MNSTWSVVSASVAGSSHVRDGRPCDDEHGVKDLGGGYIAVAVADGAGSARLGGLGAKTAITIALGAVDDYIGSCVVERPEDWSDCLRRSFGAAVDGLKALAESSETSLDSLATTLLVAVVGPLWVAAAQVGDGLIAINRAGNLSRLTQADRGEYINETTFLTSLNYDEHLQICVDEAPADGLVVMSDGLELLATKMMDGALHRPFFEPLLTFARSGGSEEELAEFLNSPRVCRQTDDDKTLVLVVSRRADGVNA